MANNIYVFSPQQLVFVANGGNGAGGEPVQGLAGFGVGAGTSTTIWDEGWAIAYLVNTLNLHFDKVTGYGPMKEYYFSTTVI